jgi:hypothetical protein
MKRKTVLIGLMMGLMLVMVPQAAHAVTNAAVTYRPQTSAGVPYALEGMSATMTYDPAQITLGCDSIHVESVYVIKNCCNPLSANNDAVELGWSWTRNFGCVGETVTFFLEQLHNGASEQNVYNFPILYGEGTYRFTVYVDSTDHLFHFFYDDPNSVRHIVTQNGVAVTRNPNAWGTWATNPGRGAGIVSMEVGKYSDQLGQGHVNVWANKLGAFGGWNPVNVSTSSELGINSNNFCPQDTRILYGSGSIGDSSYEDFKYPHHPPC